MDLVISAVVLPMLVVGVAFNLLGTVALYRFPDVYTRLHGTTKCTTFGSIFTSGAVIVYGLLRFLVAGDLASRRGMALAIHAFFALMALLITNPTGSHALARAAHRAGIRPWGAVVDRLEERRGKEDG